MITVLPTGFTSSFSQVILCVLFVAVTVIIAQLALSVFNRWATKKQLEYSNEVASIVFGSISLIYSLILAFIIVAVWDDYTDLNKTIEAEADKLNSVMSHSASLPDSLKKNLNRAIYNYCNEVINNEWQMNTTKTFHQSVNISNLREQILTTEPQTKMQENIFAVLDADLNTISDLRRERLSHSHSQIPDIVWLILDAGSIMMVIFFFFLKTPSLKLQRIYLSFLASCIAMCMFLVYTLDHPFNDKAGISNQLYQNIQTELKQYYDVSNN